MLESKETWFSKKNEALRPAIKRILEESKERFGGAKIATRLREEGILVSQKHAYIIQDFEILVVLHDVITPVPLADWVGIAQYAKNGQRQDL